MYIKQLLMTALAGAIIISACKKKSDDDDDTTPTPTPTPTKVICDGNGTTTYFPLKLNNVWKYSDDQGGDISLTLNDTSRNQGHFYFDLYDPFSDIFFTDPDLREDSVTKDIYLYESTSGDEYLWVPANPVVGTTTPFSTSFSMKVLSTTASITTDSCSYTGLLEMQKIIPGGTPRYYFYKKGIGMVAYRDTLLGIPRTIDLKQVTLN
jgi:hypothetical protein